MRSESDRKIIPAKTENTSTYLHGFKEFTSKRPRIPGGSPDLTEKRILAAAETVFSRDGFQGATTHEIAQQAGVNEVTIFRIFIPGKSCSVRLWSTDALNSTH
jgi:hypothetical protein